MISVVFKYVYHITKTGKDNFQYCEVEISGHSAKTDAREQLQVCSAVSAICNGIYRLFNDLQFTYEYDNGYFHAVRKKSCWVHNGKFNNIVDSDTNHALNTILCQLFEVYQHYPKHFSRFDIIELKEYNVKTEYGKEESHEQGKFSNAKTRKYRRTTRNKMGLCSSCENESD